MRVFKINPIDNPSNYNNGQCLEQTLRFYFTGKYMKADNEPAPDFEDIQIKSARATICPGLDITGYVQSDKANRYAYITKEYKVYMMSKAEYIEFATAFKTITKDSEKNGGGIKTRLKHETKRMLAYLALFE